MTDAFTYAGYRELIGDYLAAGHRFAGFAEAVRDISGPVVLMRQDIDFDIAAARTLAENRGRKRR